MRVPRGPRTVTINGKEASLEALGELVVHRERATPVLGPCGAKQAIRTNDPEVPLCVECLVEKGPMGLGFDHAGTLVAPKHDPGKSRGVEPPFVFISGL